MFSLRAVEPDWLVILDGDGECFRTFATSHWHKAGENGIIYWGTRLIERALRNGMVHWIKGEDDIVTFGSSDRGGVEDQPTFTHINCPILRE